MPDFDLPRYNSLSAAQSHAAYRFVKFFCDYSGDEESQPRNGCVLASVCVAVTMKRNNSCITIERLTSRDVIF